MGDYCGARRYTERLLDSNAPPSGHSQISRFMLDQKVQARGTLATVLWSPGLHRPGEGFGSGRDDRSNRNGSRPQHMQFSDSLGASRALHGQSGGMRSLDGDAARQCFADCDGHVGCVGALPSGCAHDKTCPRSNSAICRVVSLNSLAKSVYDKPSACLISPWARVPTPIRAKAGSMPTHQRLGADDRENQ